MSWESEQRFKLCGGEDISIQEKQAMPYQYSLGVFYRDLKLMHVTLYRCFDRLFGSYIINEFLKEYIEFGS